MKPRSFATAALLLVLAAAAARPVAREERTARASLGPVEDRCAGSSPLPVLPRGIDAPTAPLPVTEGLGPARRMEQDVEERFWAQVREALEDGGSTRHRLLEATAGYLGWGEREKASASGSVQAIGDAWRIRDLDLGAEPASAAQERYEDVKRLALESVAALLDGSRDRHRRFRERLEEWVDALR